MLLIFRVTVPHGKHGRSGSSLLEVRLALCALVQVVELL